MRLYLDCMLGCVLDCVLGCVLDCMLGLIAIECGIASLFIDHHLEAMILLPRRHLVPMHKIDIITNAM